MGNAAKGTCGQPPSPEIDGFPTAVCGSATFDEDLDGTIGYFNFDAANYSQSLQKFVPGLDDVKPENNDGFGPIQKSQLSRLVRRANPIKAFGKAIIDVRKP